MASAKSITVRSATSADADAITGLQETGFGMRYGSDELPYRWELFPVERSLVAVDGDRVVGHTVDRTMTVTVPGARQVQACGVSGVAVAPTHRRRGILRFHRSPEGRPSGAPGTLAAPYELDGPTRHPVELVSLLSR